MATDTTVQPAPPPPPEGAPEELTEQALQQVQGGTCSYALDLDGFKVG